MSFRPLAPLLMSVLRPNYTHAQKSGEPGHCEAAPVGPKRVISLNVTGI